MITHWAAESNYDLISYFAHSSSVMPIEAKVGDELLGVVQIRALSLFAQARFPHLPVRPLGVKNLSDATLLFVEFNDQTEFDAVAPRRYKRYELIRKV